MRSERVEYQFPMLEVIGLIVKEDILTMSGGAVGIGDWVNNGDDFGGSAS